RPAWPMAAAARSPTCSSRATASRSTISSSRSRMGWAGRRGRRLPSSPPLRDCWRDLAVRALHRSIVAVGPLQPLVIFLGLEAQGCDRPRFQPLDRDRFVGFHAIAISALLDALEGLVDLGQQLALPVAGAQLQRPVGLARGAVRDVGLLQVLFLEMLK